MKRVGKRRCLVTAIIICGLKGSEGWADDSSSQWDV